MKTKNKHQLPGVFLALVMTGGSARATIVMQYSFEGNSNDSAPGGVFADTLFYIPGASASTTARYAPGVVGQAGVFDGNSFFAQDSADLGITTDWTIEAFISVSVANGEWERTVVKWGTTGQSYHFGLRNGSLNLFSGALGGMEVVNANTTPSTLFAAREWHHVAITSSLAGSEAWIDGASVFTGPSITFPENPVPLGIGDFTPGLGDNNALRFHGLMDEVRIHDSAVDQAYIESRAALLVPEPSGLSFLGLSGLAFIARRRR